MWILVFILSIKLEMPTWYWILFTMYTTVIMPIVAVMKYSTLRALEEKGKNK